MADAAPRVLTALPVYNEERHVNATLDEVARYATGVLVVDDGSSDATPELLDARDDITVIHHPVNRGYGAALVTAFEHAMEAGYDTLVTIDCDGQHEPKLIPTIANALHDNPDVVMVSGSRYLKSFTGDSAPPEDRRRINVRITCQLNALFRDRFDCELTDAFCGFKAYRVDRLSNLEITELGYAMPLQLWVQAAARGWRIAEFPVPLVYLEEERSFGGSLDVAAERMAYYQQVLKTELTAHFGGQEVDRLELAEC